MEETPTPTPEFEFDITVPGEKRSVGRPRGSLDQIKRLPRGTLSNKESNAAAKRQEETLPAAVVARLKGGTGHISLKEKAKQHADREKVRRDLAKQTASETALTRPVPEMPKVAPTEKQKLYVRESIERVIALAKVEGTDKSRMDALIDKAYLLAMDSDTDLEVLLKVIKLIADRLEGEVGSGEAGAAGAPLSLTINVNATRFQVKEAAPAMGVIDVD